MPEMTSYFHCTQAEMQLSYQCNAFFFAIASLIVGPLSDRMGRKPFLVFCCFSLCLSTAVAGAATNITAFLVARCTQGLGGCAVVVQSTYRDVYDDLRERTRAAVLVTVAPLIGTMVAPLVGTAIAEVSGSWRFSFIVCSLFAALLTFMSVCFVKETLPPRRYR